MQNKLYAQGFGLNQDLITKEKEKGSQAVKAEGSSALAQLK